jgi:hypothetical protein
MTEAEWQTCVSSGQLIERVKNIATLTPKAKGRKCRLAAIAMVREFLGDEVFPDLTAVIEAAELFCDGQCSLTAVDDAVQKGNLPGRVIETIHWGMVASHLSNSDGFQGLHGIATQTRSGRSLTQMPIREGLFTEFVAIQCRIIREIFANPSRPVMFSPSWRTDTALSLAGQMYESRDFGAMPILADALQDAGCENEAILNHCQDAEQTHIRGCWVVDLVLGKA